jgi:hypothetical protein
MDILVSGKFSSDIFDGAYETAEKLRDLAAATDLTGISTELASFVYVPVIFSDDLGIAKKSRRSHSRKENAEIAHVEIDHEQWSSSNSADKFQMMLTGLKRALEATNAKYISPAAVSEIVSRLDNAGR